MAELVTVYRARPDEVAKVMGFLQGRNVNPVVLDDAGKMGAYRDHSHEVRIAVPDAERDVALGVLKEMQRKDESRLAPLISVTNGIVLLCIAVLVCVAIVALLDRNGKWFAAVWLVLTAVVAVALIRWAWRKDPRA